MTDFYCDEVLTGHTPVELVAESERAMAFRHTRPAYPVHIVVIPRAHIPSLLELDDSTLVGEVIELVRRVAREVLKEQGSCRVVANLGSYQESEHLHLHVVSGERHAG